MAGGDISNRKYLTLFIVKFNPIVDYTTRYTFFAVFPLGCHSYQGPYSFDCLVGLWRRIGCGENGYQYPLNLTIDEEIAIHDLPSIRCFHSLWDLNLKNLVCLFFVYVKAMEVEKQT